MSRTFLTGATLVAGDLLLSGRTLVIEHGLIADLVDRTGQLGRGDLEIALPGRWIAPGFIDLHIHGVAGVDVLDGRDAVSRVAAMLPRWGVTAFSPTSLACPPDVLGVLLGEVREMQERRPPRSSKVLPAHLESNFLNPDYRGAQPLEALRLPDAERLEGYSGEDVIRVIEGHLPQVGIVTLAPEIPGGLALLGRLVSAGVLVSVGHTGATFEEARAAFDAGASRATHLYSAMPAFSHRDPGVVGAVLTSPQIFAELICDGVHVHPAAMQFTIAARSAMRVVGVSDGTAASGLPAGSRAHLGGRPITAADVARLDNGAMAGSVLTMDRALATLVSRCHVALTTAVRLCATHPAEDMRLGHAGVIAVGAPADLVVLNQDLGVEQTWIDGVRAYPDAP